MKKDSKINYVQFENAKKCVSYKINGRTQIQYLFHKLISYLIQNILCDNRHSKYHTFPTYPYLQNHFVKNLFLL